MIEGALVVIALQLIVFLITWKWGGKMSIKIEDIKTIFKQRKNIHNREKGLGIHKELNEQEKAMLEFIASRNSTTITDIANEDYFNNLSFSTIKRAVLTLQLNNFVNVVTNKDDKRKRSMVVNLEKYRSYDGLIGYYH